MPRARRPIHSRLRTRLVVAIGVLVAALAIVVGTTTYFVVRDVLTDDRHRTAEEQFAANQVTLGRELARDDALDEVALLRSLRPQVRARELLFRNEQWYAASDQLRPEDVPMSVFERVGDGATVSERHRGDIGPVLVLGAPVDDALYFELVFLSDLERTLSTLRTVLLATGLTATLLAMTVAWQIARRSAAPLEEVANASALLADGALDTRIGGSGDQDLGRIAAAFNHMAESLQERIERESRFTADVSHELRTPMTTLVNSTAVLQRRRDQLSPEGREALDLLAGDVERFQRTIDALIEIAKHDAGTVAVDLTIEAAAAVTTSELRRLSEDPPPVHDTTGGALVAVDRVLFARVLANLVANANAYAGSVRAVTISATERDVTIAVDDDGPGVAARDRERIFERFARGRAGERPGGADGSGLGLSLARECMRAMGGAIWVTDASPSGGARFVCSLPRYRSEVGPGLASPAATHRRTT